MAFRRCIRSIRTALPFVMELFDMKGRETCENRALESYSYRLEKTILSF